MSDPNDEEIKTDRIHIEDFVMNPVCKIKYSDIQFRRFDILNRAAHRAIIDGENEGLNFSNGL